MDVDDLVIGSGLSALGTVLGLATHADRRIGVLCGPADGGFAYYDARRTVPCAYLGEGGLGSHWHGVIPTGRSGRFESLDDANLVALFSRFYPHADLRAHLGSAGMFVPWRAIRPAAELRRLSATLGGLRVALLPQAATGLHFDEQGVRVETAQGTHHAARAWLAAGALHTPALLDALAPGARRGLVSDHAFCYIGQVQGQARPRIERSRDGAFYPARHDAGGTALYSLRPAAFAYRRLDHGIEQRAVFGLPTGSALTKLARRMSPGLLVEAFYNRFGVFGGTSVHSAYAQVPVPDAYEVRGGSLPLLARPSAIRAATDAARRAQPFEGLRASRRTELSLPGIHLHHSLDPDALLRAGINGADAPLQVVDASVLTDIGPDHHSFKMLVSAHERARRSGRGASTTTRP